MSTGNKKIKRGRVWPAIVAPLGLTLLLGAAGWLFLSKVRADNERTTAAALRLESYARLEAGELAGRAGTAARAFLDARFERRAEQEKNIRVELRGIMEAVYRVIGAGLEKTRAAGASSRDVGDFPPGFEGLRAYLELAGPEKSADAPVEAMRACIPELSALIPSGCSLAVIENNVQEVLSVGGGAPLENARAESMTREFVWGDGGESRRWTIRLSLAEADAYPVPDAAEIALHISGHLADSRLDGALWRGWLVDRAGQAVSAFPVAKEGEQPGLAADAPPFIDMPGEWVEVDGRRLVWQERAAALEEPGLIPAVAVSIDRPSPPVVWHGELKRDLRWSLTLGVLALLSLGMWGWFFRALSMPGRPGGAAARRAAEEPERLRTTAERQARAAANESVQAALTAARAAGAAAAASTAAAGEQPRRRLVRDESARRVVPEVPGVIVADIGDDGEVIVEAEIQPQRERRRVPMPTGSLLRLQERHRGGRGMLGSRVLDQARSQVLRELAKRVRPVVRPASPAMDKTLSK